MATSTKAKVGFFTDDKGNKSSMRIISFIGSLMILGVWTVVSLIDMKMTPIGYEHVMLLAVLVGGKAGQTIVERMK